MCVATARIICGVISGTWQGTSHRRLVPSVGSACTITYPFTLWDYAGSGVSRTMSSTPPPPGPPASMSRTSFPAAIVYISLISSDEDVAPHTPALTAAEVGGPSQGPDPSAPVLPPSVGTHVAGATASHACALGRDTQPASPRRAPSPPSLGAVSTSEKRDSGGASSRVPRHHVAASRGVSLDPGVSSSAVPKKTHGAVGGRIETWREAPLHFPSTRASRQRGTQESRRSRRAAAAAEARADANARAVAAPTYKGKGKARAKGGVAQGSGTQGQGSATLSRHRAAEADRMGEPVKADELMCDVCPTVSRTGGFLASPIFGT